MKGLLTDIYNNLNWVDVGVMAILLFSLIVGLMRGFFTQIAGIAGVIGSILLALHLAPHVSDWIIQASPTFPPATSDLISFSGLFLVIWIFWLILTHYLKKLLIKLDFGAFDRFLGGAFGVVKGALVAYVFLVLVQRFTSSEWAVNQEIVKSESSRGIELFDSILKSQRDHIPGPAWNIIVMLRRFPEEAKKPDSSSSSPGSGVKSLIEGK